MTFDTPGLRLPPILLLIALSTSAAQAQTLPWPTDPPRAGAPAVAAPAPMTGAPMAAPRPAPAPNAAQQECMTKFTELRANVEKLREAVDKVAGSGRSKNAPKASREDVCKAISNYAVAEGRWMKFIVDNTVKCSMPPELGKQISAAHTNTQKIRKNVCAAGPAGGAPAAPSLSDALGTSRQPVTSDSTAPRGTFDTLSGSAIAR